MRQPLPGLPSSPGRRAAVPGEEAKLGSPWFKARSSALQGPKLSSVRSSGRDQSLVNGFALTNLTGARFVTRRAIHKFRVKHITDKQSSCVCWLVNTCFSRKESLRIKMRRFLGKNGTGRKELNRIRETGTLTRVHSLLFSF